MRTRTSCLGTSENKDNRNALTDKVMEIMHNTLLTAIAASVLLGAIALPSTATAEGNKGDNFTTASTSNLVVNSVRVFAYGALRVGFGFTSGEQKVCGTKDHADISSTIPEAARKMQVTLLMTAFATGKRVKIYTEEIGGICYIKQVEVGL